MRAVARAWQPLGGLCRSGACRERVPHPPARGGSALGVRLHGVRVRVSASYTVCRTHLSAAACRARPPLMLPQMRGMSIDGAESEEDAQELSFYALRLA